MIGWWLGRWPWLVIRRKGGRLGKTSRVVSLAGWSHLGQLEVGEHVYIGPDARLFALGGITIGTGSIIGPRLTIYTSNHDFFTAATIPYSNQTVSKKPVTVGQGCWLGDGVMLLPGATLGDHCLVGAGAVVRGSFPPGAILTGNPATITGQLGDDQLAAKREALARGRFHVGGGAS